MKFERKFSGKEMPDRGMKKNTANELIVQNTNIPSVIPERRSYSAQCRERIKLRLRRRKLAQSLQTLMMSLYLGEPKSSYIGCVY